MNKKFMIGGCAAIAVAGNVFAAAEEDYSYFTPFASLKAGCAFLGKRNDIKYKCGFAGGVELGMSYDAWKFGVELGFKQNKIKEQKLGDAITAASAMSIHGTGAAGAPQAGDQQYISGSLNGFSVTFGNHVHNNAALMWEWDANRISKIQALSGMMNVCYDYAMTEAWSIYAGLGLGVAKVSYTLEKSSGRTTVATDTSGAGHTNPTLGNAAFNALKDYVGKNLVKTELSKTVFAWQLMAGVGYEFDENWKLTFGYKLFNTAKVKIGDTKIKTPFNHTAELGLTYTF